MLKLGIIQLSIQEGNIEKNCAHIEELVRNAYNNARDNFPNSVIKIQQGVRYYLEGTSSGQKIRIWINVAKKVIETAFPK